MNWTEADLLKLDKAIASGVRRIEYHDKILEYKTLAEMLQARRMIVNALQSSSAVAKPTRIFASSSKGTSR